jgi:hypothetical protein
MGSEAEVTDEAGHNRLAGVPESTTGAGRSLGSCCLEDWTWRRDGGNLPVMLCTHDWINGP